MSGCAKVWSHHPQEVVTVPINFPGQRTQDFRSGFESTTSEKASPGSHIHNLPWWYILLKGREQKPEAAGGIPWLSQHGLLLQM